MPASTTSIMRPFGRGSRRDRLRRTPLPRSQAKLSLPPMIVRGAAGQSRQFSVRISGMAKKSRSDVNSVAFICIAKATNVMSTGDRIRPRSPTSLATAPYLRTTSQSCGQTTIFSIKLLKVRRFRAGFLVLTIPASIGFAPHSTGAPHSREAHRIRLASLWNAPSYCNARSVEMKPAADFFKDG